MSGFLSSFAINLPDIPAKIYTIGAEIAGDPYSQLSHFENVLESQTGGEAYRVRGPDGNWYLAVFGQDHEPKKVDAGDSVTLSLEYRTELKPENPRHRTALEQALRDSLRGFFTSYQDYWEYNDYANFYDPDPVAHIEGHQVLRGIRTSIDYREETGFMLSLDPTRKFIPRETLADLIDECGAGSVVEQFGEGRRYFFFDRPEPQPVRLHSVTESTVSEQTMEIDGEPISVLKFVDDNYGSDYAGKIDPTEPVVQINYSSGGRSYDAAPSLLRLIPQQQEAMTKTSTLEPEERWSEVQEWMSSLHYLTIGNETADIEDDPIRRGLSTFALPPLEFGDGSAVLETGTADDTTSNSDTVTSGDWRDSIRNYLREFGPRIKPMDEPRVSALHTDSTREEALEALGQLGEYLEEYFDLPLRQPIGGTNYQDRAELDSYLSEYGDDIAGVLAYMTDESASQYHELIDAVGGKPTQHLTQNNYLSERNRQFSQSLFHTATDLGAKLGVRPFLLDDGLSADVLIGMSVTGNQRTTASSVVVSGETGNVIDWTEQPHGRGKSSVADHDLAERLVGDGIAAAAGNPDLGSVDTIAIHKNGSFGNEEVAGIRAAIETLQEDGYLESDISWSAVELRSNTAYRIYSDRRDRSCDTGSYAKIDEKKVLLTPSGRQFTYQGTPRTFEIRAEAGTGDMDIVQIGKDIFDLSCLVWWAPGSKISDPITIRYPNNMNELFEHCQRLQYLPS
ncbi:hypothetical protein [Haloglomus halophilum]|uniref:hypothetical protein n=1 Tax=Haloglomus halophilum TaxID=2962672 RepID=UPI0020C9D2ED|nr:hypothetical protein [Haloglomus halophilum]